MHSRRETVERAIRFGSPGRLPVVFWNRDQAEGDVMLYHLSLGIPGDGDPTANAWDWSTNEWGYRLESLDDGTMGHPAEAFWPELPAAEDVRVPPLREEERMQAVPSFVAESGDRYRLASLDLSGFTVYTLLRGFENAMLDFVTAADRFQPVMDRIMDFECRLIELAARHGFHGIHFADDWGTQTGLMLLPALWCAHCKIHAHFRGLIGRAMDLQVVDKMPSSTRAWRTTRRSVAALSAAVRDSRDEGSTVSLI